MEGSQLGGGDYPNARIADIALSELGRNRYTPGPLDHGQCKQSVNDWVAAASGGTQRMGGNYYSNYARNGGTQISRDSAAKGDIIQLDNPNDIFNYYRGMHTAVVVSHNAGSNSFDVVDSNFKLDDVVRRHDWNPYAAAAKYGLRITIWRMGTVRGRPGAGASAGPGTGPGPRAAPPPPRTRRRRAAPPTRGRTTRTPAAPRAHDRRAIATVQIACKLHRLPSRRRQHVVVPDRAVARGTTRTTCRPTPSTTTAQTSGSLHGTPSSTRTCRNC